GWRRSDRPCTSSMRRRENRHAKGGPSPFPCNSLCKVVGTGQLLATHFAEKYTALGQSHRTIAVEATNQKPVVARTPGCGPGPDGFMVETSPILLRTSGRTATMRLACDRYRSQS